MADYHFVYKDLKGTSTQWDDIQRKLGNLPEKPPAFKPPDFTPADDEDSLPKDKSWIDSKTHDELEDLEDDFDDDRFLEDYRRKRLEEMKQAAKVAKFVFRVGFYSSAFYNKVVIFVLLQSDMTKKVGNLAYQFNLPIYLPSVPYLDCWHSMYHVYVHSSIAFEKEFIPCNPGLQFCITVMEKWPLICNHRGKPNDAYFHPILPTSLAGDIVALIECYCCCNCAKWAIGALCAACDLLLNCLEELARRYPATKFVKIISTDCIPNYPDRNLPTLLVYNNSAVKANYVGMQNFGRRCTPEGVALVLCNSDPVLNDGLTDGDSTR
ncbi:uncharacterized protein LOC141590784 [Silene latifolia]|uniref:uncharacterized protein LOC141590784 n=1 Tax=Silene latifolia TaxID=37657 RepID=UPI003D772D89